ncbi:MAG: hypothetical protein ACOY0T_09485 [Myxococcota bacterium]
MEHDEQSTDSVFDFLYVDHVRIAVFLSQLPDENHGHLEKLTVEDSTDRNLRTTAGVSALTLAKGEIETNLKNTEKGTRTYDPLWLHARQFLDVFDELGMVKRDLAGAEIGDLVVTSGGLSVTDMRMLKPLWRQLTTLFMGQTQSQASQPELTRQQRRAAERKAASAAPPALSNPPADFIATVLETMPHTVTGTLSGDAEGVWFTMVPERMSVSPEEMMLKFGTNIPGQWHVAGLVDALPDELQPKPPSPGANNPFDDAVRGAVAVVREQMGRPKSLFGMTPLLVFRKLGGSIG